jgi:hypothetical protein
MVSLSSWLVFAALTAPMDVEVVKFTASACAPCQAMEPVLEQVAERGFPVRRIDVDQQRELAEQYQITSVPTLLVVSGGQVVDRIEGALPLESLLRRLESVVAPARSAPASNPVGPVGQAEDGRAEQLAAQATVRLRVEDANGHSFGTGTVIDIHGQDALVLTCGHIFRDSQGKGKIVVELFAPGANGPMAGELIRCDLQRDLALVGVRTTAKLRPLPVAPPTWQVAAGQQLFSVGCNQGEDPSLMRGRLKAINKYLGPENLTVEGRPSEGRSGGGLFSYDGHLVGVCNAADPEIDEGLYAAFISIHRHLDDARLSFVYQRDNNPVQLAAATAPMAPSSPTAATSAAAQLTATAANASNDGAREDLWSSIDGAGRGRDRALQVPSSIEVPGAGARNNAAEVICIIRTQDDPTSPSQVVVLDRPSRNFLSQLHEERRAQVGRQATQLRTPPTPPHSRHELQATTPTRSATLAKDPPVSTVPESASSVPQRPATARFTSDRRLHRPTR